MSATEKTRGKKTLILAIIAVCAAIAVLIAVFMPTMDRGRKGSEEVISRRVKVESPAPEAPQTTAAPAPGPTEKARVEQPQPEKAPAAPTAKEPVKAAPEAAKAPAKARVAEKAPAPSRKTAPDTGVKKAKKKAVPSSTLVAAKSRPWALNVASYSEQRSAKGLAASLRAAGYNAYTTEGIMNGKTWHRVRVGFYRTREEAEKAGKAIEKRFDLPSAWVVKPSIKETASNIKR